MIYDYDFWEVEKGDVKMVWREKLGLWEIKIKGKTVAILRGRGVVDDSIIGPLELIVYHSSHVYQASDGVIYITF
jgi:hypothetical protein